MDITKMARAWRRSSGEDLKVAYSLFDKKHYAYCLFFCHLAAEKELKRIYVLRRGEIPPFIHNLLRIADKANLKLDDEVKLSLQELTTFNIKARYEIIRDAFHRRATKSYTQQWLKKTEELLAFLRKVS